MKILFYSHFYYPEVGAASVRIQYFVNALRNAGHEVLVITPRPNYPFGKKYKGYEKNFIKDEKNNVIYLPIYIPSKHTLLKRGLSYFSYSVVSFFYALKLKFRFDLIITSMPPITTTFVAVLLGKIKRKPVILDIRDMWPDIGIQLNILTNKYLIWFLSQLDKFQIRNSQKFIVVLNNFEDVLLNKGVSKDKITVIFNGADTEILRPISKDEKIKIREKYFLPINKKIAVYYGFFNFGMNDIDTLAEAAILSSQLSKEIYFVFIGDGVKRNDFENKIKGKVEYSFFPPLNTEELSQLAASCDLSLVPLKKVKNNLGGFIPVKCIESWAMGLPVLYSYDGDYYIEEIFKKSKGGMLVNSGDAEIFAKGIVKILSDEQLNEYGKNGRKFVEENFDRKKEAEKIVRIVKYFENRNVTKH